MSIGPIEYLVVAFPGNKFKGEIVPALAELVESNTIRILDLVLITRGSTPGDALRNSLDLARHAERLGYTRYWIAEHHGMTGIGGAATSVVIGHIAGGTSTSAAYHRHRTSHASRGSSTSVSMRSPGNATTNI